MTGAEGEGVWGCARARVCARSGGETAAERERGSDLLALCAALPSVPPRRSPSLFPGTQTSGVVTCEEA